MCVVQKKTRQSSVAAREELQIRDYWMNSYRYIAMLGAVWEPSALKFFNEDVLDLSFQVEALLFYCLAPLQY